MSGNAALAGGDPARQERCRDLPAQGRKYGQKRLPKFRLGRGLVAVFMLCMLMLLPLAGAVDVGGRAAPIKISLSDLLGTPVNTLSAYGNSEAHCLDADSGLRTASAGHAVGVDFDLSLPSKSVISGAVENLYGEPWNGCA